MLSFRKLLLMILGVGCILLLPQIAVADSHGVDGHCMQEEWNFTLNNQVALVDPPAAGTFSIVFLDLLFNKPAKPSLLENCVYEISEISKITLTLKFEGKQIDAFVLGTLKNVTNPFKPIPTGDLGRFQFINGGNGTSIQFPSHENNEIAFHLKQGDLFGVNLIDINETQMPKGRVTADIEVSGIHYSRTPEPGTVFLLGTGVVGVAIKMRKRFNSRKS